MRRFEMAKALIVRAQEHIAWIGNDHGDPYEAALLTGSVPIEFHVRLKETFGHLRSALDYAAHEICEVASGKQATQSIYFPITAGGFSAKDFPSRVKKLMPGLLPHRPDLVPVLERYQPYSSLGNAWLGDLATLANLTKHVDLVINEVSSAKAEITSTNGQMIVRLTKPNGTPVVIRSLMLVKGTLRPDSTDCRFSYLSLVPINEELSGFLSKASLGTQHIIDDLEAAL